MQNSLSLSLVFGLFFASFLPASTVWGACADVKSANLRSGPGTKYRRTGKISHNDPLQVLKEKNGWSRVKNFRGKIHWVRNDLISSEFKCGIVTKRGVNLRSGPGTNYQKLARAKLHMKFRVKQEQKDWISGNDGYGEFWVHKDLVWVQ